MESLVPPSVSNVDRLPCPFTLHYYVPLSPSLITLEERAPQNKTGQSYYRDVSSNSEYMQKMSPDMK